MTRPHHLIWLLPLAVAGWANCDDPAGEVNPLGGTGAFPAPAGDNNVFPGAVAPFGLVQWSPDTELGLHKGGYFSEDRRISDFSFDHISGAGGDYGGDWAMMPMLGSAPDGPPVHRNDFAVAFSHTQETAAPGYYAVTLANGIKVELAATVRSGSARIQFPAGGVATLMINAASDMNRADAAYIEVDPTAGTVSGWTVGGHFCNPGDRKHGARKVYFFERFSQPFSSWAVWQGKVLRRSAREGSGTATGAYLTFDLPAQRCVLIQAGESFVSVANAKANLAAENSGPVPSSAAFDQTVRAVRQQWNARLERIKIQGGEAHQRRTFYTMLYHALLGPSVVSDANGEYFGYDEQVHQVEAGREQYGVFSGWDIYRSECQLLAMIAPKEASDMAQSLLLDYRQGGAFPRWGTFSSDSGAMVGDPAAAMIADFYAFGATAFDARGALAGLLKAADDPSVRDEHSGTHERDALGDYLTLGYIPEYQKGGYGSVSMTLEYCSADFALSQFAAALGDQADSSRLLRRTGNWRNHLNPQSGCLEMRRRDGSWAPHFTNRMSRYDGERAFVEGSSEQYTWMVPFDYRGLISALGGPEVVSKRLDQFFTKLNAGYSEFAYLGNESCVETPWIYDFLGQPWKTQALVRRALQELYSDSWAALPGNDDVGEMSSWYVLSALGFYPELPGSDVLVLGSPLFPRAELQLRSGKIAVVGRAAAADAPYIQSLTIDGRPWNKPWIRFADVAAGATLHFSLGSRPNLRWGSNPADAPPSCSAP